MPKEFVHNTYFGQYGRDHSPCPKKCIGEEGCVATQVPLDSSAMKIGWSKEQGHVELAVVEMHDGHFVEHGFDAEEQGVTIPRYMQFDRYGLNRLIKVARQARDDAFGKDE